MEDNGPGPLHSTHLNGSGQVGLLRERSISGMGGLYTCIIPDEDGNNVTLKVALYATSLNVGKPIDWAIASTHTLIINIKLYSISGAHNRRSVKLPRVSIIEFHT